MLDRSNKTGCGCLVVVLIVLLGAGAFVWFTAPSWVAYSALRDLKPGAWIAATESLKQYLHERSSASFPCYLSDDVRISHDTAGGASLYVISSYVEARDKDGKERRVRFGCAMVWRRGAVADKRWHMVGAVVVDHELFRYLPPTLGGLTANPLNDRILQRLKEMGWRLKAGEAGTKTQ